MLTKDDIETIALVLARTNAHPAPGDYAQVAASHFEHLNDVSNASAPIQSSQEGRFLTDASQWPATDLQKNGLPLPEAPAAQ